VDILYGDKRVGRETFGSRVGDNTHFSFLFNFRLNYSLVL
jgi:hypothetical protein